MAGSSLERTISCTTWRRSGCRLNCHVMGDGCVYARSLGSCGSTSVAKPRSTPDSCHAFDNTRPAKCASFFIKDRLSIVVEHNYSLTLTILQAKNTKYPRRSFPGFAISDNVAHNKKTEISPLWHRLIAYLGSTLCNTLHS